jgi:hypothetical protein
MSSEHDPRVDRLVGKVVGEYELELRGLSVLTEAASGAYLATPLVAAMAGAHVFAIARDSRYARAADVRSETMAMARRLGVAKSIEIVDRKTPDVLSRTDIVTNSGFVRPIDRETISRLPSTAVISLMWETWEFRLGEVDLDACDEFGIAILGTEESAPPLRFPRYVAFAAMKLLFELGLEGHKTQVIVLGGGAAFGAGVRKLLRAAGLGVEWFADDEAGAAPYADLAAFLESTAGQVDALILAEHRDPRCLVGEEGMISARRLAELNPALRVAIIAGNVDTDELAASGLMFAPAGIQPFGYMSYGPSNLGPRPVIELYAAGLKVGQALARARRRGDNVEAAKAYALAQAPAMEFPESVRPSSFRPPGP